MQRSTSIMRQQAQLRRKPPVGVGVSVVAADAGLSREALQPLRWRGRVMLTSQLTARMSFVRMAVWRRDLLFRLLMLAAQRQPPQAQLDRPAVVLPVATRRQNQQE